MNIYLLFKQNRSPIYTIFPSVRDEPFLKGPIAKFPLTVGSIKTIFLIGLFYEAEFL
jgi:hypothetical protein